MQLRDFFSEDAIQLDINGTSKDDVLKELIALLKLDDKSQGMLFKMLKRRENLGPTGVAGRIANPPRRSAVVHKPPRAFCRQQDGVGVKATRQEAVNFLLLIVAPPPSASEHDL